MNALRLIFFSLIAIAVTGYAAGYIANYLARKGVFSSCFEGACGYGAAFVGFPIAWVALLVLTWIGYRLLKAWIRSSS